MKLKQAFFVMTMVAILFASIMSVFIPKASDIATADNLSSVLCDELFCQTLDELLPSEEQVVAEKKNVFDADLNNLGIVYEFVCDGDDGYVIMINSTGGIIVTEACVNGKSPYYGCFGKPVYISELNYWCEDGGLYYSIDNELVFDVNTLKSLYPQRYCAIGDSLQSGSRVVEYANKTKQTRCLASVIPAYDYETQPNACAPTTGASIIAYYDRFCEDLIPDYTPGFGIGAFYRYYNGRQEVTNVISQLYIDMQTNSTGAGTSVAQFKSGMTSYCERNNCAITFTSSMTNGAFDYAKAKSFIDESNPIVLFVQKLEISTLQSQTNRDTYTILSGNINHTLSAFGYEEVNYTMSDGTQQNEKFLYVATGIKRMPQAYLNMNGILQIDDAYGVSVTE